MSTTRLFETDYADYSALIENAPENTGVEAPAGVAFLSLDGAASELDGGVFKFATNLAGSFLL